MPNQPRPLSSHWQSTQPWILCGPLFPAKYLDKGVAVQPLFFYMGHISRYVRPGSRAVQGLVTQGNATGRIFRPAPAKASDDAGSTSPPVTGGGQNDLARVGIEITVWPCEGSTRQQFSWTNTVARGNPILVHGHDWLGHPTTSCIGHTEDVDVLGLRLVDCENDPKDVGLYDIVPVPDDPLGRSRIYLSNYKGRSPVTGAKERCLVIRPLANHGGAYGPRGGAQVTIGSCSNATSLWHYDAEVGEFSSLALAINPQVLITTTLPSSSCTTSLLLARNCPMSTSES